MNDFSDPFLTFLEIDPDFNESDDLQACKRLYDRQGVIQDWLAGETEADHVLETLLDQGQNPDNYVDQVVAEVEFLISTGQRWRTDESGLLLPEGL